MVVQSVRRGVVFGPCFVIEYSVSFLVMQSSRWERESWMPYFHCILDVAVIVLSQQAHCAKTTSYQRQCDVTTSH